MTSEREHAVLGEREERVGLCAQPDPNPPTTVSGKEKRLLKRVSKRRKRFVNRRDAPCLEKGKSALAPTQNPTGPTTHDGRSKRGKTAEGGQQTSGDVVNQRSALCLEKGKSALANSQNPTEPTAHDGRSRRARMLLELAEDRARRRVETQKKFE